MMMSPTLMPLFGNFGAPFCHGALNFHGAAHCIDSARKFYKRTIARRFDHAATMLGNLGIDEFLPVRLERRERTFLVNTH